MEQSYIMSNDVKEQNSLLANTFLLHIADYLTSPPFDVELTPHETGFRSAGLLGIRTLHRPGTKCNVLASAKHKLLQAVPYVNAYSQLQLKKTKGYQISEVLIWNCGSMNHYPTNYCNSISQKRIRS